MNLLRGQGSILCACGLLMRTFFFFSSRRRHTRLQGDWSSDVCSSDLSATRERQADRLSVPCREFSRRTTPSTRAAVKFGVGIDLLDVVVFFQLLDQLEIGRASCRERV